MSNLSDAPLIYVIAGEPSGDLLGNSLMRGLKNLKPTVRFAGIGGTAMQREGLKSLFPMEDLSVMGVAEVLPRLPHLIKRINQTVDAVKTLKPDCVVTIDSPDFCFRIAKKLKSTGIPLVHYVAPSVWAWRAGRAKKIAGFLDHLLALLPFEPPYFEREGLDCTFVGHPVLESTLDQGNPLAFRERHGILPEQRLLCVLPGSRRGEVERLLPVFHAAYDRLKQRIPELHMVIPTVSTTAEMVSSMLAERNIEATVVHNTDEKADIFSACEAAIAASGTVALELAYANVPSVIAYKVSPFTAFIARRLLKNRYYSLINLILDREATPECMQENCTPDNLASYIEKLLTVDAVRQQQLSDYEEALLKLGRGGVSPGELAAKCVLRTISLV